MLNRFKLKIMIEVKFKFTTKNQEFDLSALKVSNSLIFKYREQYKLKVLNFR